MTVQHSGKIMVRVPHTHFQAMTAQLALQVPEAGPTTEPLFGASHAAGFTFAASLPPEQQTGWLLHQPNPTGLHPWDTAHQLIQGKVAGSEQFAGVPGAYAEPDILNTRQLPPGAQLVPRAAAPAAAAAPAGPPWPATDQLNTNYGPAAGDVFSPAWQLDIPYGNFAAAWKYNTGAGIRIAHLDTGYTPGQMSVPRQLRPEQGYNFSEKNYDVVDPDMTVGLLYEPGHGTATLALLAGKSIDIEYGAGPVYNGDIGGAPDATVVPVRIGPSVVHFYSAAMAKGLDYALAPRDGGKCDVVSLSHGGLPSAAWAVAVNRLYEAGVVVVAAAGDSIYLKVMDIATHFTVYPSAFYRVITATGVTFANTPYITTDFGVMQGCWGPDKVMQKAVAAYTPNVPWMRYQSADGWDMDGGGTSSSTPQIAAACALWLAQYGAQYPADWRRVEACRHALFDSVRNPGANLSQIGVGLLDAGTMLSPQIAAQVQADYVAGKFQQVAQDRVWFPFFRLLFGISPPGPGVGEMYETEAAQIFHRSANTDLAKAVEANPDGDSTKALPPAQAKQLRDAFIAEPSISNTLKAYLQTQAAKLP
ncbi:MAG: S8/S53 family peptidase [Rhizomicrobium sp.]|jgi:subtilisin family serine protease